MGFAFQLGEIYYVLEISERVFGLSQFKLQPLFQSI